MNEIRASAEKDAFLCDLLIISDDVAGEKMASPGIRAWEISSALAREFRVVLAIPDYSPGTKDLGGLGDRAFEVVRYSVQDPGPILELGARSRIILTQGYVLSKFPGIKNLPAYLIVDLYVPFPLENLFVHKWKVPSLKDREFIHRNDLRVYNEQLLRGDHFLCASENQKSLFLGSLLSLNRINPEILDTNPSLEDLISVIPFGIREEDEAPGPPALRGVVPGIGADDIVLIWGGVITNWYDPETLLRALDAAVRKEPRLKLFFLAKRHPNPLLPEFDLANEAVRLSDELGLTGRHVFFNEEWVDYRRIGQYFREADIGVSIHRTHFETMFSFRIRLLEYLKYGLPILCTRGDYFAALVDRDGLGVTVESGDREGLTRALLGLSADAEARRLMKSRLDGVRPRFYWNAVVEPLRIHCRKVLAGEVRKKRVPDADELAKIVRVGPEKPLAGAGRRILWNMLHRLPFGLMTRIKRLLSPFG